MKLTTETLKQWRSDAENIARRSCVYETEYSAAEAILALTAELLANREAQPEYGDAYQGAREDLSIWKRQALEAEDKVRHLERVNDHLVKE
ncbi:DUF551 domain-containing protein, partial [Serratia sp. MF1(2023)]|nr:DUF551 domain-containing protein [Serratia sp. MF2]